MTAKPSAARERFHYPIPSSTISLDVILNEARPLAEASINACLSDAIDEARKHIPSELVQGVFKHSVPASVQVEFGIVGGLYLNELTWEDVVVVLQGLQRFYQERRSWVALIFYMEDQRRGAMGDGSLRFNEGLVVKSRNGDPKPVEENA